MTSLRLFALGAVLAGATLTCPALAAPLVMAAPSTALDNPAGTSSQFTVSGQTEIPGKTLKPGTYTIRIADHLSDRMIVEVDREGKSQARFLALPASRLSKPGTPGPISVNGGTHGHEALRGFAFPNGTLAEFVYPKAEAVGIAKANSTTIPAIDPTSEGIPEAKHLSPKDMQLVTLWLLTPTTVGPNDQPAVSAARYQAPQQGAGDQRVASASVPPSPSTYQAATRPPAAAAISRTASISPRRPVASTQVASNQVPPRPVRVQPQALQATRALPHTASDAPVVELTGLLAGLGAMLLTLRRRALTGRA